MKSRATRSFWVGFEALPERIQRIAIRRYQLWKENPHHGALHFQKVGNHWSVRVTNDYRAVGIMNGDTVIWYFIGTHAQYDRLLNKR